MHKSKKAIEKLRNYLGRDINGIEMLEDVSRIANDMRKEASAAREREERAVAALAARTEDLHVAERKVRELEIDLARERSLRQQRERDIATANRSIGRLQVTIDELTEVSPCDLDDPIKVKPEDRIPDAMLNKASFAAMFSSIRKDIRIAPDQSITSDSRLALNKASVFELCDIVKDYTYESQAVAGRFVMSMAMLNFPVVVYSSQTFSGKRNEDLVKSFVRWFRGNIKVTSLEKRLLGCERLNH